METLPAARSFHRYLDLALVLTRKEMKVRYKNYVLGYVWSIANPLAYALVFYIAFHVIMKIQIEQYALFLIAGLFPWQWFSNSVTVSPSTFLGNASLIKKIAFPRSILVLAVVLQDGLHFLISIPVILGFVVAYGGRPSATWLWAIPVLFIAELLLTLGTALFLATVNLFFRDIERLVAVLMVFVFYFTPVLYSEHMIPAAYAPLLKFHPVAPLVISWRNLFLSNSVSQEYLLLSVCSGAVFCVVGYLVYRSLSWRFGEVL
jgi:lipopolysaccharide transport system permease protein